MSAPEIIILDGGPGSGKSTIGQEFAAVETGYAVRHLPMDDRLRAIASGDIDSKYQTTLANSAQQLKDHGPVDQRIPIGVFEEFIETERPDLLVLDAMPFYQDRLPAFRQSLKRTGARVLAVCRILVPKDVAVKRYGEREQRFEGTEEAAASIEKRWSEYEDKTSVALDNLAMQYPPFELDGTQPTFCNTAALRAIYIAHTSRAIV